MKRILSLLLALIMITGTVPVGSVTAWAADTLPAEEHTAATEPAATDPSKPIVTEPVSAEPEATAPKEESPIAEKENQATATLPAPEYLAASGTCGDNLTWTLDDTGTLTISGTGSMTDYYRASAPWYRYLTSVKNMVIEDGVTSIGSYAFFQCTNLTSVTIPDSVETIGYYAFEDCTGLTSVNITDLAAWCSIDFGNTIANPLCYAKKFYLDGKLVTELNIPDSVTSVGKYAFYFCTNLTSVTIPDSVETIGERAFYNCTGLTSVNITDLAAWCAIYFGNEYANPLFYAKKLYLDGKLVTELNIPDSVITIQDYAFYNCTGLTSVTIPDSVTSVGKYAFYKCTSLTSVSIPDSVETVGAYAFSNCTGLTSVNITDLAAWCANFFGNEYSNPLYYAEKLYLDGKLVTELSIPDSVITIQDYAFYNCTPLTSVDIPDSVKTIRESAFNNCTGLTSVTIPDSVITIQDNAFSDCTGLTSVTIGNSVETIGMGAFNGTGLTSVTIGNSVKTIGMGVFGRCTGLTSVTIPDSVTSIGETAFYNCTGLTSVTIPDSVTSIGPNAFYGTAWYDKQPYGLVYAGKVAYKYKGTCPSKVTIKDGTLGIAVSAFSDCDGLSSVTIPDSVITIEDYAFYDCNGLTSVTIPNSVTSIGEKAFYYCTGLTSVTIPDSVTSIGFEAFYRTAWYDNQPDGLVYAGKVAYEYKGTCPSEVTIKEGTLSIAGGAFNGTGLTSVTIPDSVTSVGKHAFYNCTGLASVTIPDSVTTIGADAFRYCSSLTSVTIGNSVETIGNEAFIGCNGLTSVDIPDSVETIGAWAFNSCNGLTSVTIGNSVETIGDYTFTGCTGLKEIYFEGSAPEFSSRWFYGVTATAYYYPDETWTEDVMQNYGGNITWVSRGCKHSYSSTVTQPTCTAQGYTTHTCSICGNSYKDSYTSENGHTYGKWESLDSSRHKHTCTVCKTATETKPHDWDGGTITKHPTCKETGIKTYTCPTCGATKTETLAKINDHSYTSVVTPPTCTAQGYTTHTCTICGNSYKDSYISENGHTYGKWESLDSSSHKHTCTVCKTATETKPHDWDGGTITKQPTCKETGIKTYTCPTCGGSKTEIISVTNNHVYGYWEQVDEKYHKHTCTVCKTHSETAEHIPGEWIVDRAATCKQVGSQHQECADCGATLKTAEIPLADHRYESEVTKAVTCTEDGIITNTCTVCGHSYTVAVRAEHNYQPTARKEPTCTEDGSITYTCSKCQDEYSETITAGHKYVATITKVATATQNGEITYTCSVCGHSYTEVIPARPEAKVLLIQDTNPWQENNNVKLLNQMVKDGYLDGWDMVTTQFDADDLAGYSVILIANDQYSNTYSNLQQRQNLLVQFAQAGGTVIYGACDKGWANGDITYTLPGGVTSSNYYSRYNYIVNGGHPVVTGAATDGKALTNSLLYGNYCSHTAFGNLPEDAVVILQDGNGNATLVEYAMGEGHIILSGLTWEFYYTRAAYGGGDTTYTRNVYDDLVLYALQQSDPCIHVYEETKTVAPTCETNGYTVYTCKDCGAVKTVTTADKLGHTYGAWEQVDETNHKHTCTVCKTHTETKKHNFGADHVCTDCGYKAYVVGDFTGDGLITDEDVIYLLWYTVFPEDYPLNQSGDIDGDGFVTDADVIYLLWYTVFPEDYPLKK